MLELLGHGGAASFERRRTTICIQTRAGHREREEEREGRGGQVGRLQHGPKKMGMKKPPGRR